MQKIAFNTLTVKPWKNGLGTTREVMIHPQNATMDDFIWRVSMASVEHTGPFSHFPHCQRSLALLTGQSIELLIDGALHTLTKSGQPITFSGESTTEMIHCAEPALDCGIITDTRRARHSMVRVDFADTDYQRSSLTTCIIALTACSLNGQALEPLDALFFSEHDERHIKFNTPFSMGSCLIMEIDLK